ncbi:UbiA prenyltransferase family-domain-containing protein [Armillaria borealis]|uniref:UbiA prenyltransferase family-domain-containing protein n=1 Tax=Armillaria borealis TaxID=47425 RepID=A0AA39JFV6_9AGAR|nr:UbiA prenyltransferase family-domain-containing protein [Armillaria borealis]
MALPTAIYPPSTAFSKGPKETITSSFASIFSKANNLLAPPTRTEIRACWELCRLQNGMGCATVFLPVAWSLAMVYHAYPELTGMECLTRAAVYFFLCIGIKCLIMTIDDILDYDIDANVERTKNRALPRGAISIERAWLFFALQVVIGVFLAYKVLSPDALRVSMYVWPLYVLYPTCKRWMYLAPIPLGLMFNIGVYMGWADLAPDAQIPYYALTAAYIGATMWTITYETVYQHQDKVDDVKIGMKSLAILCGKFTVPICSATTVGFAALMSWAGYLNGQGIAYYIAVVLSAFILLKELLVTDIDSPRQCMKFFLQTPTIGNLILGGMVVDAVLQRVLAGIPL